MNDNTQLWQYKFDRETSKEIKDQRRWFDSPVEIIGPFMYDLGLVVEAGTESEAVRRVAQASMVVDDETGVASAMIPASEIDVEERGCEYGCGEQAEIRHAPVSVNGRLFTGDVCCECHTEPRELAETFPEGSLEREELMGMAEEEEA